METNASGVQDLTRDRVELKYLLPPHEAEPILSEVCRSLAAPGCRTEESRITTIYFDRPDGALAARALSGCPRSVKVRLRRYAPPDGGPPSRLVFVEVKERDGSVSRKARFPLHGDEVAPFFRGDLRAGPLEGMERVRRIARDGLLVPVGAACYRRTAVEGGRPQARLTIDRELSS
jgi:hypothetical protein